MIGSVNRALEVLMYLADNKEVGVRELARILKVNEATAFRLLSTLEKYNFVSQDPASKKYRLGYETIRIGYSCLNNLDLVKVAKPYLQELSAKTNETVCLLIRQGVYGVYIDKIDSGHALRVHAETGARVPLYMGGAAKALAAFLPVEEQHELLDKFNPSFANSRFAKNELINEFAKIKEQGYAVSDEEIDPGVIAIGSPVFGFGKKVIASVSIPIPKGRAEHEHLEEIISSLKTATEKISKEMGYIS